MFPNLFLAVPPGYNTMKVIPPHLTLCMYGSTISGIIAHQFIIKYSDIFSIIFVIDDGCYQFPFKKLNFPTRGGFQPGWETLD